MDPEAKFATWEMRIVARKGNTDIHSKLPPISSYSNIGITR